MSVDTEPASITVTDPTSDLIIRTPGVTDLEIAAVTAVLTAVLAGAEPVAAPSPAVPNAWARSQRPLRTALRPGSGAWRSFSA